VLAPNASTNPGHVEYLQPVSRVDGDLEGVVRAEPTQWFNFYSYWGQR